MLACKAGSGNCSNSSRTELIELTACKLFRGSSPFCLRCWQTRASSKARLSGSRAPWFCKISRQRFALVIEPRLHAREQAVARDKGVLISQNAQEKIYIAPAHLRYGLSAKSLPMVASAGSKRSRPRRDRCGESAAILIGQRSFVLAAAIIDVQAHQFEQQPGAQRLERTRSGILRRAAAVSRKATFLKASSKRPQMPSATNSLGSPRLAHVPLSNVASIPAPARSLGDTVVKLAPH